MTKLGIGSVALVVPGRNEAEGVESLLASIQKQSRQPDQVIFVDAGSDDATAQIVESWIDRINGLQVIRAGAAYPGEARNLGVAHAIADWIAFADCGTYLERDWLHQLLERRENVDIVLGNYSPIIITNFDRTAAICYVPTQPAVNSRIRAPFLASCLVRREVFAKIGGFPQFRAAEDLIFFERLREINAACAVSPGAMVHWRMANGWRSTFRRFALYSYHNVVARRMKFWHYGVIRQHVVVAVAAAAVVRWSPIVAGIIPIIWIVSRATRTVARKRLEYGLGVEGVLTNVLPVALMLLWIDVATWKGLLQYAFDRATGRGRRKWQHRVQ